MLMDNTTAAECLQFIPPPLTIPQGARRTVGKVTLIVDKATAHPRVSVGDVNLGMGVESGQGWGVDECLTPMYP